MKLNVVIAEQEDKDYGDGVPRCQSVTSENEPSISYWVSNLNDCPEDAIIPRDLFSAEDYIKALELGWNCGIRDTPRLVLLIKN